MQRKSSYNAHDGGHLCLGQSRCCGAARSSWAAAWNTVSRPTLSAILPMTWMRWLRSDKETFLPAKYSGLVRPIIGVEGRALWETLRCPPVAASSEPEKANRGTTESAGEFAPVINLSRPRSRLSIEMSSLYHAVECMCLRGQTCRRRVEYSAGSPGWLEEPLLQCQSSTVRGETKSHKYSFRSRSGQKG